ncbi:MAG: glycosyl transferase family 1, partial [Lachnospiraceae bacterium]|nr:glycosyl transferase family 1 [Lachnospiraceae bacterium]
MKILSIIAQKPNSTGSGVYLTELVRCFKNMGHINEIICACYENDNIIDEKDIHYNKIVFNTKDVPIKIAGMSDVMPYETIKYSDFIDN